MAASSGRDFLEFLGTDLSLKILRCVDDPSDLVGASAVSPSWRRFVIENKLSKQLCLRRFPQLSDVYTVESKLPFGRANALTVEHVVYSSLARSLASMEPNILVSKAISASSTDHFYEGIENTLLPVHIINGRPYWSSKGESSPTVPETLIYNLASDFCIITDIRVDPHQGADEIEFGSPIYSSMGVRFRIGRPNLFSYKREPSVDEFVWTYTSPVFPMIQRKGSQIFHLAEPVLCIGGILQIELLGRMVKHPLDDLYYICVSNVQAFGTNLSPKFDVTIFDKSGGCILKHDPRAAEIMFGGGSIVGQAEPLSTRFANWRLSDYRIGIPGGTDVLRAA